MKQKIAFKNYFYRFNFYFTSRYLTRYRTDWSCKDHTLKFQNLMLKPLKYAQYDVWKHCFFFFLEVVVLLWGLSSDLRIPWRLHQ